jgi:hypothetical protein
VGLLAQLRRRLAIPAGASPSDLTSLAAAQSAASASQQATTTGGFDPRDLKLATALGVANAEQAPLFSPGQPLPGVSGLRPVQGPRQYPVPTAVNVTPRPRSTEATPFERLRNLARLYDGVQLCEKVYFDIIRQLSPTVTPINPDDNGDQAEMARILAAFERPDGDLDLDDWVCMALRDMLELDALVVYQRRARGGQLLGLDLIDGATIKVLQDGRGRVPDPPLPGYQQILYGVPAGLYTKGELLYRRENPRTDSAYGFSRVEAIIMRVNQALRKETYDLARFTDGNVPAGLLAPPVDTQWTPDEIQAFEDEFNALLAGNDRARNRIKVLPPGFAHVPTSPPELFTDFDRFLLNVTVASFGLTMDELGFTETSNRSVGESQENVVYRRAVKPTAGNIAALFTRVMHTSDLDPKRRYQFGWQGLEEEDKNAVADRYAKLIPVGAASIDDYAAEVGLKKPGIGRYVLTKSGPIWLEGAPAGYEPPALPTAPGDDAEDGDDADDDDAKQQAKRADLRRYEQVALKALKAGRSVKPFASAAIPSADLTALAGALARCAGPDEVRAVFAPFKE